MKRGFLSTGVLFLVLVGMLGALAVGYGLWSKTLTIEGTVNTGEVNAAFSLEEVDQMADFNDICPTGGYSIGQDCDGDTLLNDDMELEGKDIAECNAELLDGLPNVGNQTLRVTITSGYPSFNCFVRWNVTNNGTIPIKIHQPVYTKPDELHVNTWPPDCFAQDTQLETGESAYCNLHVHVQQSAAQNATYTFTGTVFAHQWNEEPGP